ncbi:metallophosphoesterase [Chitinophaga sp. YIM B06452]|uniref:metallophosphoesterase family protein n=1 Tax=Chitinophaga sp. YIM B06452 TaxID=3082158 RepID=UPI0031FF05DB
MISRRNFLEMTLKGIVLIGAGNTLQSFAPAGFTLPSRKKVRLRFALASDGHYGQPKTTYYENHQRMVKWLNKEKKGRGLDMAVINGDLFHDDAKFLPDVKAAWDKLAMPYVVSHGNHDKIAEPEWLKTFGTAWHHDFEKGDAGFIVLNTADVEGKYICPDLDWTRARLEMYAGKKHLFVIMHITPVKWTEHGIDCPELVEMFSKQKNLKAVFHGHDHAEDGMKEKNGKHYFFDSHIAGSWGTPYYGYRIVEVLEDGEVLCYQVNPEQKEPVNSNILSETASILTK